MQLNNLFTDEDAVSPVIGVILMVAITVILAAVIGAFVLGIGGSQEKVPSASFSFDSSIATGSTECTTGSANGVTVSHDGGGAIQAGNLYLNDEKWKACSSSISSDTTDVTAGEKASISFDTDEVNVIWKSPSSDQTNVLGTYEA